MMRVVFTHVLAASFAVLGASAQAGLQEANAALAAKDYATALKELRPLAAEGDAYAQYQLGEMYNDGMGVPADAKIAVSWYRKSARQGYADAQAMLAIMYDNGAGVPLNYKLAMSWYRKAAEQGNPMAQSLLGSMHAEGRGTPVDSVQALKWFIISAAYGYEIGQENVRIFEAKLTEKQIKQARKLAQTWLKKHGK